MPVSYRPDVKSFQLSRISRYRRIRCENGPASLDTEPLSAGSHAATVLALELSRGHDFLHAIEGGVFRCRGWRVRCAPDCSLSCLLAASGYDLLKARGHKGVTGVLRPVATEAQVEHVAGKFGALPDVRQVVKVGRASVERTAAILASPATAEPNIALQFRPMLHAHNIPHGTRKVYRFTSEKFLVLMKHVKPASSMRTPQSLTLFVIVRFSDRSSSD